MIKIKLTGWDTHCADGCCSEWGTRLEIDGVEITDTQMSTHQHYQ